MAPDAPANSGQLGQPISVYALWFCIDAQGNRIPGSEATIKIDTVVSADIEELYSEITAVGNNYYYFDDYCQDRGVGWDYELLTPLYFFYYSGG